MCKEITVMKLLLRIYIWKLYHSTTVFWHDQHFLLQSSYLCKYNVLILVTTIIG